MVGRICQSAHLVFVETTLCTTSFLAFQRYLLFVLSCLESGYILPHTGIGDAL